MITLKDEEFMWLCFAATMYAKWDREDVIGVLMKDDYFRFSDDEQDLVDFANKIEKFAKEFFPKKRRIDE